MRLFTQPQPLDEDQFLDLSITNGAHLAEQGIITTGDLHTQKVISVQMGQ
jgi:hypothetical protein